MIGSRTRAGYKGFLDGIWAATNQVFCFTCFVLVNSFFGGFLQPLMSQTFWWAHLFSTFFFVLSQGVLVDV